MKKDDIVQLNITGLTDEGAGIGKLDGYPLFVKGALPGDVILAKVIKDKKTYGYGIVSEIIEPSPDRIEPPCPVAGPCGGCQIQALSYEAQLKYKWQEEVSVMTRIGGIDGGKVLPVMGMESPWSYRHKAEYPVREGRDGRILMGFYAGHSHNVIECESCAIGRPTDASILEAVKAWMIDNKLNAYDEETGHGLVRHVLIRTSYANRDIMVCVIINSKKLPAAESLINHIRGIKLPRESRIASISYCVNTEKNNVIMGRQVETIYGSRVITDKIGDITYNISPQSFYQVNPEQTGRLYEKALEYAGLTGSETVWDLYCGIGTISLFLARKAKKVYGVEIIPQAVKDAKANAAANGIDNAEFYCGAAEDVLPEHYKKTGEKADVIVVDPPRKGCDATLLDTMISMSPERIVYVSCNPATLARDLKILTAGGYNAEKIQPVDMFPQTRHIETVVLLSLKI